MKEWQTRKVTVREEGYKGDLHCFVISHRIRGIDEVITTFVPESITHMDKLIEELDAGGCPVEDGWQEGNNKSVRFLYELATTLQFMQNKKPKKENFSITLMNLTDADKLIIFADLVVAARFNKRLHETMEEAYDSLFRTCDECDTKAREVFIIDDGSEYYCSQECLFKNYTHEEYTEMYENDVAYWTDFY